MNNPNLQVLSDFVLDWVSTHKLSNSFLHKQFGVNLRKEAYESIFLDKTKPLTVSVAYKILTGLGYDLAFQTNFSDIPFLGDFKSLLRLVLQPYRVEYLTSLGILSKDLIQYYLRTSHTNNDLRLDVQQFATLLYKLNINVSLKGCTHV